MPKRPKLCRSSSSSSSHFLFPHDFSESVEDTDINNTLLERLRPTEVPFWGYETETKALGEISGRKVDFFAIVAPSSE